MSHVYFAANEASAFFSKTANCLETTSSTTFDSNYCRAALGFSGSATSADKWTAKLIDPATNSAASLTSFWLHFDFYNFSAAASAAMAVCNNSSGVPVFKAVMTSATAFKLQYWNGTAFVDTGASATLGATTRYTIDIRVTCGASGSVDLYVGGSLISSGTIASSSTDNFGSLDLFHAGSTATVYSQILVKDATTILRKVGTRAINATGNYGAWTGSGTITNINETVLNDATLISDNTNGDKTSFKMAALTVTPTNVEAVVGSARINNDASGIQNCKLFLRESTTDYLSNALTVVSGLAGQIAIWETDPATSAAWAVSAANSTTLEIGVQANT